MKRSVVCTKRPTVRLRDVIHLRRHRVPPEGSRIWFGMNGRYAIRLALECLDLTPRDEVLVPAFHCSTLVEPVLRFGSTIRFYSVGRDFSVDVSEIEASIRRGSRCVILVHFIGIPGPVEKIREICKENGAFLIEDCTHALGARVGDSLVGSFGDASVFSFRKSLPVVDGGALVLRDVDSPRIPRRRAPLKYELKMLKWTIDRLVNPRRELRVDIVDESELDRRVDHPPVAAESTVPIATGPSCHDDPAYVEEWESWSASRISRWIVNGTDVGRVREARARNYLHIHEALSDVDAIRPCFSTVPDGISPMGYPFLVESNRRVDYALRTNGVPAFSFGEDLHESLDQSAFPDASYMSRHLALLPVHQTLTRTDVDRMAELTRKHLA